MASASRKGNDGGVTEEQLKAVEYELQRSRCIEENERQLALVRAKRDALQEDIEANRPPNKKRKAPSPAPVSMNEGRVLRSSGTRDRHHVDPAPQPSEEITPELDDEGHQKKSGRKITQKVNIYSRLNQPKIKIPLNDLGQPVGPDATKFTNFIGTLVRKHIPPAVLDWRDVDEEKKLLVCETLKAFYEVDSTALKFVICTSHTKWKDWKGDLKKSKFDAALTDEQLMRRRDERTSEADWKALIDYWRSSVFESRSAIAKQNRANVVPHTSGSKSHARVTHEMAEELGHIPRRDQVYIRTHTRKKGGYVLEAASTIKDLIDKAEEHPEWKEKSITEGDLFARVCGMKEPRGRVRVLGLGPTPQDLSTPGTRGKMSTRVLVEMEGRRQAENRMNQLEEQVQQMKEQMNRMQELLLASQGGHNLGTPSSQHGSNSRQNSRVENEEDNDGEEDDDEGDDEGIFVHRRVVPNPPAKSLSTHRDESLIGKDVLLYSWIGPETSVAKATIISIDQDTCGRGAPWTRDL